MFFRGFHPTPTQAYIVDESNTPSPSMSQSIAAAGCPINTAADGLKTFRREERKRKRGENGGKGKKREPIRDQVLIKTAPPSSDHVARRSLTALLDDNIPT